MTTPSDNTERSQCMAFVDQIFTEAAGCRTTEILFRVDGERIQTFLLVDGQYEKGLALPRSYWDLIRQLLVENYFEDGEYHLPWQGNLCVFTWLDENDGCIRMPVSRKPIPGNHTDRIEDIFRSFEDQSWDSVKSIFLSILNLALEQGYDAVTMEIDGHVVDISYFLMGIQRTSMTISSDSYDALTRLIGENYLAFGFMTREFRTKEYLIRLKELNEDMIAPKIWLEIEALD